MSAPPRDSPRRDGRRFFRLQWKRVAQARREAGTPWTRLAARGALAACLGAGINAAAGPEGWRTRLATVWIASLWALAPLAAALAVEAESRLAERSGAFDELRLAEDDPLRLDAILRLQAALSVAGPIIAGTVSCALLAAFGAWSWNGSTSLGGALAKTVGPTPAFLLFFCALAAFPGQGSRRRLVVGALGYWSAFALFMPALAAYPLAWAKLMLSP